MFVPPAAPLRRPWTLQDALNHRNWVSRKRAHKKLHELRWENGNHLGEITCEAVDLTYSWPWDGYLANHPQKELVIGEGVVLFEFRFCRTRETNTRNPMNTGPVPTWRADFVHQADGTVARVHPSQNKEARLVTGRLQDYAFFTNSVPHPEVLQRRDAPAASWGDWAWMGLLTVRHLASL